MRLKDYMVEQGLTAPTLAERLGYSLSAVRKWMQRVRVPKLPTILRIKAITHGKVAENDWD